MSFLLYVLQCGRITRGRSKIKHLIVIYSLELEYKSEKVGPSLYRRYPLLLSLIDFDIWIMNTRINERR